jgi:hypothetical protein
VIKVDTFSDNIPMDPRDQRIAELEAQLRKRDELIAALQEKLQHLEDEMEKTKRAGKRQATPFARKKRVAKPKQPGRRKGQGKFSRRRKPGPEEVKETKKAPLECCPDCGGWFFDSAEGARAVCGGYSASGAGGHALRHVQWALHLLPTAGAVAPSGADFGCDWCSRSGGWAAG